MPRVPRASASIASQADKYDLYQRAVQAPDHDVRFLDRIGVKHSGRLPRLLREDFCGTALVSAHWVARRPTNVAHAIDIDPEPLAWGERQNRAPLGAAAKRLHLRQENVLETRVSGCDIVLAPNFSFCCFHSRDELLAYFRAARRGLRRGGLLVADIFGGPDAMKVVTEKRRVGNFTYVWEQSAFDPITSHLVAHIGFRLRGGREMRRVFTYDWRLWSLPEILDVLRDAGFESTWVYWELTGKDGRGTGTFRAMTHTTPCDAFVSTLVARK